MIKKLGCVVMFFCTNIVGETVLNNHKEVLTELVGFIAPKKNPDDFVLDALVKSGTLWWGSQDWKKKILKPKGKEHTSFKGEIGYGAKGEAKFALINRGELIEVESEFKAEIMGSSLVGLEFHVDGLNLNLKEGVIELPEMMGKYSRCRYAVRVEKQQQTNSLEKLLRDAYEYPNCTNLNCNNPECIRLRNQRFDRDLDLLIYDSLKDRTPRFKLIYTAICHSKIPVDQIK